LFERGRGVAQDSAEAERYYLMAAAQGDLAATFQLEDMYELKHDGGTKLKSIRALQHAI
jgi:TPR repeat protein